MKNLIKLIIIIIVFAGISALCAPLNVKYRIPIYLIFVPFAFAFSLIIAFRNK